MRKTNLFIIMSCAILMVFLLCSCSRGSMTRAGDTIRNTARRTENFMDNGLNAVPNNTENGRNPVTGGMYGANSNYSGNTGIGSSSSLPQDGNATPLLPTLGNKERDNVGQINTNRGSLDGGIDDNKTSRSRTYKR